MTEKILILDFGSQYTQLIARAVREANVYCEIFPYNKKIEFDASLKGIILSGSPFSVNDAQAPEVNIRELHQRLPVLAVCYGAQLTAKQFGGRVAKSNKREFGRALMHKQTEDALLQGVMENSQVWMSHSDSVLEMPDGFEVLANTESIPYAAFKKNGEYPPLYCVQFHPEVYHSIEGKNTEEFPGKYMWCQTGLDAGAFHYRYRQCTEGKNRRPQSDHGIEWRR